MADKDFPKVIFSNQEIILERPSIFLGGPTPRDPSIASWRLDAMRLLAGLHYQGTVFVPEHQDPYNRGHDFLDQAEWEYEALEGASVIAFWIPRDLNTLPGFTTNVEFGRYVDSGRCVYGRPEHAQDNHYLDWLYNKLTGKHPYTDLESTLKAAIIMSTNSC